MTREPESCPISAPVDLPDVVETLRERLLQETYERRRAECTAEIQSHAVQLTLDLLVQEPDRDSFFRQLMRALLDHAESDTCAVWLLDEDEKECELWMAYIQDRFYSRDAGSWGDLALPRQEMVEHLQSFGPGWKETIDYAGDDERLPESVRAFNRSINLETLAVVPLKLTNRNLGWIAMSTAGEPAYYAPWRRATLEAIARQITLSLHQSRLAEDSLTEARRQAVLEERNRIARDIHDTLAQGFAAILMQLQSVQRTSSSLPANVARSIDTAVDLARTHMIEARRSVGALRPQEIESGDIGAVLERTADLARRTTDVPIEVTIDQLPPLGGGVEREIVAVAQEALANAVRHARARHISIHASSTRSLGLRLSIADDGRGIARERFGAGFGLTSMQERAERIGGSLTIVTAPRAGTEVVLAWEPPAFSIPNS